MACRPASRRRNSWDGSGGKGKLVGGDELRRFHFSGLFGGGKSLESGGEL